MLLDSKYANLLTQVLNKEITVDEVIAEIKQIEEQTPKQIWPFLNEMTIRVDSAAVDFFDEQLFDVDKNNPRPKLSIKANQLAMNLQMSAVPTHERQHEEQF